jgi:hypothetical protein
MKRQNHLFEQMVEYGNIRLAFLKAIRGKRSSPAVINFCRNTGSNLAVLRDTLYTLNCEWGNYHSFPITDPKFRIISSVPVEQRIMHHAIMNVLDPVFERPMICHSYACRRGKGTHAAVRYAFSQCKSRPWFLKLDIRKYFDSIDHDALKTILHRLIKDPRVMALLHGLIDSYETDPGKGIPIGNLTSQFFANLYLTGLDHFILETLHPLAYCRYMDDFVLWGPSPQALKTMYGHINTFVGDYLRLTLKQPIYGKPDVGLPFLGFLIKEKGIYLLQKSKRRVTNRMAEINTMLGEGEITGEEAAGRATSVFAAIAIARTKRLRRSVMYEGERLLAPTV